ncbi:hypothetical protein BHE74_00005354 [Ensete ventricosum]|nr:hypothetical protein BHE74_00005354 [Ensete ventricosum]
MPTQRGQLQVPFQVTLLEIKVGQCQFELREMLLQFRLPERISCNRLVAALAAQLGELLGAYLPSRETADALYHLFRSRDILGCSRVIWGGSTFEKKEGSYFVLRRGMFGSNTDLAKTSEVRAQQQFYSFQCVAARQDTYGQATTDNLPRHSVAALAAQLGGCLAPPLHSFACRRLLAHEFL